MEVALESVPIEALNINKWEAIPWFKLATPFLVHIYSCMNF